MEKMLESSSLVSRSWFRRSGVPAALVMLAALALVGCDRKGNDLLLSPATTSSLRGDTPGARSARLDGPGHLEGELGPGARWSIDRPAHWNGDLVVWLHGYSNPAAPIALPAFAPMRDELLAAGYAVVASSYSENGYAVKEATIQSHQLRGVFVSNVGAPRRTFLVGVSLGGLVGALLTERYPGQYDGSLLISGVVGGSDDELAYIGDVRVLFDVAYPGVLPGSLLRMPLDVDVNQTLGKAQAAIQANPANLGIIVGLARVKPEYSNTNELVQSILTAIGFQLQGANDLLDRTQGHSFFENRHWVYTGPVPQSVADYVNATVARYSASADARAYVEHYGEPSGDLQVPVIALHNRWDPVVPSAHEALYASAAGSHGGSSMLLQRMVPRYGHVAVSPSEMTASLNDLAHWVETGTRPAN